MSFGEFRDSNLRAMFEAVSLKNLQLQQAIRNGDDHLVRMLDREIDPMIATGIAIRSGHGVAITSTARNRDGSPLNNQAARPIVTATGVYQAPSRSASRPRSRPIRSM